MKFKVGQRLIYWFSSYPKSKTVGIIVGIGKNHVKINDINGRTGTWIPLINIGKWSFKEVTK